MRTCCFILRIFPLFLLLTFMSGCKTAYYQLVDLPVYAPLDENSFRRAEFYAVYPPVGKNYPIPDASIKSGAFYFMKIPPAMETRLLTEMMKKHGYQVYDYSKCISVNALTRLEHVVQVVSLSVCRLPVADGVAVTYRLVVMVRPKYTRAADNTMIAGQPYFFQAYHRFTVPFTDKTKENQFFLENPSKILDYSSTGECLSKACKHHMHTASFVQRLYFQEKFVRPVFANLFLNPDFRKALQPGFLNNLSRSSASSVPAPHPTVAASVVVSTDS